MAGFVILSGLGVWQLQRLAWKQDLIARVESRTDVPPVAAPGPDAWPDIELAEVDYLPVSVFGTFWHDLEVHAYAVLPDPKGPEGGQGYFVVTPLETEDGWVLLVNRGFVPEWRKEPATRQSGQTEGLVEVVGLIRPPQGRNAFTPADDVDANIWYTRDPIAIGNAVQIQPDRLAPYYIDAVFDPDLSLAAPQGGETIIAFPNNHLQYAVTWLGLAVALAVVSLLRIRSARREGIAATSGPDGSVV